MSAARNEPPLSIQLPANETVELGDPLLRRRSLCMTEGGEYMSEPRKVRTYERPTLTAAGSFKKTGLGLSRGPEKLLVLRFSL